MKCSKKTNGASRNIFEVIPQSMAKQSERHRILLVLATLLLSVPGVTAFADSYTSTFNVTWGSPTPLLAFKPGG